MIRVENLNKTFKTLEGRKGFMGAVQNLFSRDYRTIEAVRDLSFHIPAGEVVGFIGPNGAGKSTTIKILTGILVPTGGRALIKGVEPYRNRQQNAAHISVVFGQRTKLWWDLPCMDSFELHRHMYRIPQATYDQNLAEFTELLELDRFWKMPVRQLSLGQRMRAEIALSLMHNPDVVYLDEPTIGMDAIAKERIRRFLAEINQRRNVTILITSHDMADIERLCSRVLIIDKGRLIYDGPLAEMRRRWGQERLLIVEFAQDYGRIDAAGAEVVRDEGLKKTLRFSRDQMTAMDLIGRLGQQYEVTDVSVVEPEIETIIRQIYEEGAESAGA